MDKGEDGIAVSATHLTLGQQLAGDYEKVCVGTVKFGMRSTQVTAVLGFAGGKLPATTVLRMRVSCWPTLFYWLHKLSTCAAHAGPW
jgi:hypothetical protein